MKPGIKRNAQGGFTLIELIVVIVILGILAATALPKFASLGGDARFASLNAARGALSATAAMAHGKFLANPTVAQNLNVMMEDQQISLTANGYPTAVQATAFAAGLAAADYQVFAAGTSGANQPTVAANQIAIVPAGLVGSANAANCYLTYTTSTTAPPTIVIPSTVTAATCN